MATNQYIDHPWFTSVAIVVVAGLLGAIGGYGAAVMTRPAADTSQPAQVRDIQLFTVVLPFDDVAVGVPHDAFQPSSIIVNQGDTVRLHFYNTEDEAEDHVFAMDAPYAMKYTLHQGEDMVITFVAGTAGTFNYYCDLHEPTMAGTLTVLG